MNTITQGKHTLKFGARVRETQTDAKTTNNFNGSYSFGTPSNAATGIVLQRKPRIIPRLPALTNPELDPGLSIHADPAVGKRSDDDDSGRMAAARPDTL